MLLLAVLGLLLAFVVLAGAIGVHAGGGLDGRVVTYFEARQRAPLTTLAVGLGRLGVWWLVLSVTAILVATLWYYGRRAQATYLGFTMTLCLLLNLILKLLFQRQPPGGGTVVAASNYAFPSGHTMTTTAFVTAIVVILWVTRWRWPVVTVAGLAAVAMGASRVYLAVHWPSDVAAGWALGVAVALGVRVLLPWHIAPASEVAAEAGGGQGGSAASPAVPGAPADQTPPVSVVFLDWGNTLMVDDGMHEGPMMGWPTVEAVEGAREALEELHARCRLVVATNAEDSPAWAVRAALARVGLDDLIDDVVSSADIGDRKPHYAFYRAALLSQGFAGTPLDPRAAVMIGDGTTNDILGAQQAGLRTIWFNPTGRRYPAHQPPPDAEVRKLTKAPAALDRIVGVKPRKLVRKDRRRTDKGREQHGS